MLVVFAANQVLTAPNGGSVAVTTEPVALDGFNVMTAVTTAHDVFGATAPFPGLRWRTEVSMDGQTWVNQGPASGGAIRAAGTFLSAAGAVTGVWVRLLIEFDCDAGALGAATFDIHANFTKS